LVALLQPRDRVGTLGTMESGGSRPATRSRAETRPAAGFELSRLFLDRSGGESGTRPADDPEGGRIAARRRLHRRQPRLGALPPRRLFERGPISRKGDRARAGGPD